MDGSSDATELLGMGDFVVLATTLEDDERYVLVETRARVVGCPTCGVVATGHREKRRAGPGPADERGGGPPRVAKAGSTRIEVTPAG